MSNPKNISVTSQKTNPHTPLLPPCSTPYRWMLHAGRYVSVYFDPNQPEAVWSEYQHPEVQVLYFGPGSDCTTHWMQNGAWTSRHVHSPSLWVIGVDVPHKLEWRRPVLRLAFYIQSPFVAEFKEVDITGSAVFPIETVERCNPKIAEFLRGFEQMEQPRNTVELLTIESSAHLVSMHLCQAWTCLTNPQSDWRTTMSSRTLAKVDIFIESHIDQKITLEDIAREVGMSKSNFMRLFKKRTGVTAGRHLVSIRIQKSKTLLVETDWTIGTIAAATGFSNQGHFDSAFKKQIGITPKEFRKSHRIGDIL